MDDGKHVMQTAIFDADDIDGINQWLEEMNALGFHEVGRERNWDGGTIVLVEEGK